MKLIMTIVAGLMISFIQDKQDLVGRWKFTSFDMDGKNSIVTYDLVFEFNRDGSYKLKCNSKLTPEKNVCEWGRWKFNAKNILHLDPDNQSNVNVKLHPYNYDFARLTADSLVINTKEVTKDIVVYYIRQQ